MLAMALREANLANVHHVAVAVALLIGIVELEANQPPIVGPGFQALALALAFGALALLALSGALAPARVSSTPAVGGATAVPDETGLRVV